MPAPSYFNGKTAGRAFTYAKSRGILAKSLLGKRQPELASLTGLDGFAALVHAEGANVQQIERHLQSAAKARIFRLLEGLGKIPPLLTALLRKEEAAALSKALALAARETAAGTAAGATAGAAAAGTAGSGETGPPEWDSKMERFISRHTSKGGGADAVRFNAYPNLAMMLDNTPYASLTALCKSKDISKNYIYIQSEINKAYWKYVFSVLDAAPYSSRALITKLLQDEAALQNTACALRLRLYYGMGAEAVERFFVTAKPAPNRPSLVRAARQTFNFAPDHRAEWLTWKYLPLLNPETPGAAWRADPRYFQNSASAYLYRMARKAFYHSPFTLDSPACFIYLKQQETRVLTGIAEGLALGMSGAEILRIFELERPA